MIGTFVSDVHSEKYEGIFQSLKQKLDNLPDAEFIVLAGDIGAPFSYGHEYGPPQFLRTLEYFCNRYSKVIYVPGNHDYWLCKGLLHAKDYFHSLQDTSFSNFYPLINETIILENKKIFGGPLWFHSSSDPFFFLKKKTWVDFHLMTNTTLDEHDSLSEEFKLKLPTECDLVISHHLPHSNSIDPRFINSPNNCFFLNDCDSLIQSHKPKIWIHGHTHTPCNYIVHSTEVLCNPIGYPNEHSPSTWLNNIRIFEI